MFHKGDVVSVLNYEDDKFQVAIVVKTEVIYSRICYLLFYYIDEITGHVETESKMYKEQDLVFYVNPHKLIRPLKIGDSVVLKNNLLVYFDNMDLKLRGKTLKIKDIQHFNETGAKKEIYICNKRQWIIENIDIPKTNLLLVNKKSYSTSPPHLPII